MNVRHGLVTDTRLWTDRHGLHMRRSFVLRKQNLKSDLHTGIKVTLCLLIIFVGLGGKCIIFIFCFLVFVTRDAFPQLLFFCISIFSTAPSEMMDGGFTVCIIDTVNMPCFSKTDNDSREVQM
jgi:hypothetical protein